MNIKGCEPARVLNLPKLPKKKV